MFEKLMKEVSYSKTAGFKRQSLFHAYGRITMAREMEAITEAEFMELNTACVRDGINNPKYFDER